MLTHLLRFPHVKPRCVSISPLNAESRRLSQPCPAVSSGSSFFFSSYAAYWCRIRVLIVTTCGIENAWVRCNYNAASGERNLINDCNNNGARERSSLISLIEKAVNGMLVNSATTSLCSWRNNWSDLLTKYCMNDRTETEKIENTDSFARISPLYSVSRKYWTANIEAMRYLIPFCFVLIVKKTKVKTYRS